MKRASKTTLHSALKAAEAGRRGVVSDVKSLLLSELQEQLRNLGEPSYRAGQIVDWLYEKRVDTIDKMTNLPRPLRSRLSETFSLGKIDIVRVLGAHDTTRKFLFRLADGNLIESVLIPASPALYGGRADRRTICVSTQVGCAYGCKFCASGLEGFSRNLSPNEIVDQLIAVERAAGEKIDNIVFMGMGEPLANLENVLRAIRIINAEWGLGIGARHITISTSGLAPQIRRLAEAPLQIRLAVSLHGATDEVRNRLSAKVNLIPYNSVSGLPWTRPSEKRQEKFLSILRAEGISATLRREKGHDIDAACGQLRLQTERTELTKR